MEIILSLVLISTTALPIVGFLFLGIRQERIRLQREKSMLRKMLVLAGRGRNRHLRQL